MLCLRTRGRHPEPLSNSTLMIQDTPTPQVPAVCIPGVPLRHDDPSAALIPQFTKAHPQLTRLNVCHQHAVVREDESCKLKQALLLSRITYGTTYVRLEPPEFRK